MKNETKYELNNDGKYDVMYRGFDYMTMKFRPKWFKVREVETEDEAKQVCADCLDFND